MTQFRLYSETQKYPSGQGPLSSSTTSKVNKGPSGSLRITQGSTDFEVPQPLNPLDDWSMMLNQSPMARSPGAKELLTTIKTFFMFAGYATPRTTIGMTDAHIEKFKSDLSVHLPETVREEVALSQALNQSYILDEVFDEKKV